MRRVGVFGILIFTIAICFLINSFVYAWPSENFDTYTEDDPPGKWEITDNVTATFTQYKRRDSSCIWKYKGNDYITKQFTLTAWIKVTEIDTVDEQTWWAFHAVSLQDLQPKVDDIANYRFGAVSFEPMYDSDHEDQYLLHFTAWYGGLERVSRYFKDVITSNNYNFQVGTTYYIKMMKNVTVFRAQAFSDPLFMNLIADTYDSVLSYGIANMMNYSYVDVGWWVGGDGQPDPDDWMSGWIKNVHLTPLYNETEIPFGYNTTIIRNSDGTINDGWLFKGEIYSVESYFWNLSELYLNFTDGKHDIKFQYFNDTQPIMNISNEPNEEFTIGLIGSDIEEVGNQTKLTWTFILDVNIVDKLNVGMFYQAYNKEYDYTFDGDTEITFNIYNLGGFYNITTDNATLAGRIYGGDFKDLWNYGFNESVEISAIFRKLQHIHLTCEWEQDNPYNAISGYYSIVSGNWCDIYFAFDYWLNASWVEGWTGHIEIEGGAVGNGIAGNDLSYEILNVTWYNRGKYIKSQNITSYHYGYDPTDQPTERKSVRLWVDLWFDRLLINESNVVGGRVNAYFNGMKEFGNPWWFGYGNFRPMISNVSASMFFDILQDANNNSMSISDIDLVRFRIGLNKDADLFDHDMKLHQYQIFNYKQADDRMEGIDTPIFVEPEDISMPKGGGFLAPLYKAIEGISTAIWKGALGFIKLLWGAMDSLMRTIGLGDLWDMITSAVYFITNYIVDLFEYVGTSLNYTIQLVEQIFRFVGTFFFYWINLITNMITRLIEFWSLLISLFTGGWEGVDNIWEDFGAEAWITLFLVCLPIIELVRLIESDDVVSTLRNDISFIVGMVMGLLNFIMLLINIIATFLNILLSALPI